MSETPNHKLNLPAKGAENWDEPLNENFSQIDSIIRSISTDGTSFQPETLKVTSSITWPDGSQTSTNPTNKIADSIVLVNSGTTTAYTSSGQVINSGTDAGVVIQSAVDAVRELGGGVIEVGPGTYPISSPIRVYSNMSIKGAGMGVTVFEADSDHVNWTNGTDNLSYFQISDITFDGQNKGDYTGFNFGGTGDYPRYCQVIRCEALNCGGRDATVSGTTPAIMISNGHYCAIKGCRTSNCSSVSVEIKTGENSIIQDCEVVNGTYETSTGFCHGISVEKSNHCMVQNNYVTGQDYGPAININNISYVTVQGNIVENTGVAIRNANGSKHHGTILGNVLHNTGPINIKEGGSGSPYDFVIANNALYNASIVVDKAHASIFNNQLDGGGVAVTKPDKACSITGNQFRNFIESDGTTNQVRVENSLTDEPLIFANNHFDDSTRGSLSNKFPVFLQEGSGICLGNHFGSVSGKATVRIKSQSNGEWLIGFNRFRMDPDTFGTGHKCLSISDATGIAAYNIFDGGEILPSGVTFQNNIGMNGAQLSIEGSSYDLNGIGGRIGTYSGDGTVDRTIPLGMTPEHVVVEAQNGTKYDTHLKWGKGYIHAEASGEFTIVNGGFRIGDGNGDGDPNSAGSTYEFYAK